MAEGPLIRKNTIQEEPVIGPLGEICYFHSSTTIRDLDPFPEACWVGGIGNELWVNDDGSPLEGENTFGLWWPASEQLYKSRLAFTAQDLWLRYETNWEATFGY